MQALKKVPDFFAGGGEMGERIRNFDWSKTPLGAPENWDQSLKTCVRIMLTSSQPIWIGWGKQLIKLYNDPYKAIVGGKHPQALGQPASVVWKDIWKDIEPMLKQVMEKNEGTYVESQLLIMERYGYPEETYYTFSYSPVPGDDGGTAGMICYNTADTERIITERSLHTLQELARLAKRNTLDEVYMAAIKAIEKNNKDFPCAIIYKIDEEENIATAFAFAGITKEHPELPKIINLDNPDALSKNLSKAITNNTIVLSETAHRWKNLPKGAWQVMAKNFVHIPVSGANKKFPLAVLSAALNPYRKFDDAYKNFVQLVADQISLEVNNVLILEEERKRAKVLGESEQRFRSMADEAPLFVWVTDKNLQTTFINKTGRMYFNVGESLNPADLSWKKYIHPDDINMVLQVMQNAAAKREPYTLEMRLKNGHTGNYQWFLDKGVPRFEKDALIGFIGTSLNIHDRKEAEAALRITKEQLEVTFKNVPAGIYQFNKQGSIEYINERGAKLLGYESVEEVMAQPHMQQFINHINDTFIILDEEGNIRPDEKGSVYIAVTTGKTAEVISQFINKKKGTAAWLLSNSTAVYDDNGEISFILTTATDITESKKAELALRESENRFRTLAETLPHMVWVRNVIDNTIEYGSKSWEDYSGIKDISTAWKEMVHPDDWKTVMEAWDRDSAIDKPFRYEVRLKNKKGEYRWHYTAGEPLKDGSGKIVKWIGAMTDIHVQKTFTEKLEQEVAQRTEELVKANKELESFNYIASHDLQEPLRKIQTFIALIEKNEEDGGLTQRYFEKIKSSARRMSELIQAILSYSRLSIKDLECVPTDLNKILNDVETDFELLIKEKNADIQSNKLPVIKANPLQMHQLFSNLIGNSLKFSKENPEIKITSQIVTGDKIKLALLTFADNGIGFDSQFKEQIFQLFQRLHGKQEYAGTGIGLSIVKKIVEQHKGFVTADSVNGKGATFKVWLPVGE